MDYKFIDDLTSDVMFEAYGKTLVELLENAATAMFSVICDIKNVSPLQEIKINISEDSEDAILHRWLCELLTQSDIHNMFFSKFEASINGQYGISGIAQGEPISPKKSGTVVKGVTYYGFKLEKTNNGYKARVAIDI
ncbi:MAG: archease [Candidatus Stahlbacteria bacterium]|nr:archease [Candidatus Stahlbacteria bacterium]